MNSIPTNSDLYADGGVIGHNPSEQGGTWAFCVVQGGERIVERAEVITPKMAQMENITNNLTEMLAVVNGLKALPADWAGTVYSDSQITLGRVAWGWKWKNIPTWVHHEYQIERARLVNWDKIKFVLLQGHPTKSELEAGVGRKGYSVSEHNVWCDRACGLAADMFRKMMVTA